MKDFVVWELFSGNGDITKALNRYQGIRSLSFDWEEKCKPDFLIDLMNVDYGDLVKLTNSKPDFIWASPECKSYSIASRGIHRCAGGIAVSEFAKYSDALNEHLINEILLPSHVPFIIENPRGHFRNMEFVKDLYRTTIYFGNYGGRSPKPTDLFSFSPGLERFFDTARGEVFGIRKGENTKNTLGYYSGYLNRCKMPERFVLDICAYVKHLSYK